MTQSELANIIRRKYKAELEALNDTIKKQEGDKRKYRDEYYFNSGKEWACDDDGTTLDEEKETLRKAQLLSYTKLVRS